jgi:hypothetical protein
MKKSMKDALIEAIEECKAIARRRGIYSEADIEYYVRKNVEAFFPRFLIQSHYTMKRKRFGKKSRTRRVIPDLIVWEGDKPKYWIEIKPGGLTSVLTDVKKYCGEYDESRPHKWRGGYKVNIPVWFVGGWPYNEETKDIIPSHHDKTWKIAKDATRQRSTLKILLFGFFNTRKGVIWKRYLIAGGKVKEL